MGLPRCARTPFGSKSWTNYAPIRGHNQCHQAKKHIRNTMSLGVLLSEMTSPTSCTYVHGDHVLPTVKLSWTSLETLHIELFRLQTAAQIFNLVWTWLTFRSPKPQAHSASLGSTLKSPGRQDFVPKNLGVSLASRWSRLLSHLLSSLDVLWKLAGFPVGSSKKFLSNRWLKNGNKTCHSP